MSPELRSDCHRRLKIVEINESSPALRSVLNYERKGSAPTS